MSPRTCTPSSASSASAPTRSRCWRWTRGCTKGEPIAAIVAESESAGMEAAAKVRLDMEELPAVLDVEEALKPGAPVIKDWGTNYFVYEGHHCRRGGFGGGR